MRRFATWWVRELKFRTNAKALAKEFEKIRREAKTAVLKRAVTKACYIIHEDALRRTPVNTGRLRNSIAVDVKVKGTKVIGIVGTNVKYAPFVEFGTGIYAMNGQGRKTPWVYFANEGKYKGFYWTRGQKPKKMLTGAFEMNKERIRQAMDRIIKEAINKI